MQRSQWFGEVAEWLKAPHSKCGIRATVSGVRIPPSPPTPCIALFPDAPFIQQPQMLFANLASTLVPCCPPTHLRYAWVRTRVRNGAEHSSPISCKGEE